MTEEPERHTFTARYRVEGRSLYDQLADWAEQDTDGPRAKVWWYPTIPDPVLGEDGLTLGYPRLSDD